MNESFLEAVPRVRRTDPGTSHEAAVMAGSFAKDQQSRIRATLVRNKELGGGPMGAEEIGQVLGIEPYAIRKRLSELMRDGFVTPVGERRTKSGRTERTWGPLF